MLFRSVLGATGIETYDIIAGVTEKVKPDIVITVDSLSSRSVSRLASAFQITDTGIAPGSGIGNHRFRLDRESLGTPVIAVGVPLVVYASTIANEIIDEYTLRKKKLLKNSGYRGENPKDNKYNDENLKAAVINSTVTDILGDLIVTPKDIDVICGDCAYILALAINSAVHNLSIDKAAEAMN